MTERDKELLQQSGIFASNNVDMVVVTKDHLCRFSDLIRADEREAILELADSLGWVDVDAIRARGNT